MHLQTGIKYKIETGKKMYEKKKTIKERHILAYDVVIAKNMAII